MSHDTGVFINNVFQWTGKIIIYIPTSFELVGNFGPAAPMNIEVGVFLDHRLVFIS